MIIRTTAIFISLLALAPMAAAQSANDFVSPDGICDGIEYATLSALPPSGNSVTVSASPIRSGSIAALPMTETVVPAFTPVKCFGSSNDLVLVLSEDGGQNYCGWVRRDTLLSGAQSNATGVLNRGDAVCPTLRPMNVTEYCSKIEAIGDFEKLCDDIRAPDGSFVENPIETKFLTWNADQDNSGDKTLVPLFNSPTEDGQSDGTVSIFTTMRVWDVAIDGDTLFTLVGPDQKSVVGWVPASSGTVWFSKLTTFFSENNDAPILTAEPGTTGAEELAKRPPNLSAMLSARKEFDKYPVLVDRRDAAESGGTRQEPHLNIAFIGAVCDGGTICADTTGESVVDKIALLEKVDVLFVIDATKSMRDYYKIVADAVATVASERSSTTTRFGVIMYGDFLSRQGKGVGDQMQIRSAIDLTEIFSGDEFDGLPDEKLYIKDAAGGRREAAFAALYQSVEGADWRDGSLRFVIHLADHGDRGPAPDAVVTALQDKNIFYVPIAVRGEYIAGDNKAFVDQTQDLLSRHTFEGASLGLPTAVTFEGGQAQSNNAAKLSIVRALRAATEVQDVVNSEVAAGLVGREGSSVSASNRYPPGYAQLTNTVKELYGIDDADVDTSIELRTLAAPGYIAVPQSGISQDWTFQVAITPRDLSRLINNFDLLCKAMQDSNAQNDLSIALRDVIEVLTGDVLTGDGTNERFYRYFDERENIPLVARTILGEGILELGSDMRSLAQAARERVEIYRLEACRTSKLLRLMDSDRLVPLPYENAPDGSKGDLIWDADSGTYNDLRSRDFIWTKRSLFDVATIYLPLAYMPRPYSELR
ncbi:MAG: hypothetical protein AAF393_07510 [Pseudomonadota bacterium]